jgi:hypothetical protein
LFALCSQLLLQLWRDRQTDRQRDRETVCVRVRGRDRETERQRDRETERQRDREMDRQRDSVCACVREFITAHDVYIDTGAHIDTHGIGIKYTYYASIYSLHTCIHLT